MEALFWSQILGDYLIFIRKKLSVDEKELHEKLEKLEALLEREFSVEVIDQIIDFKALLIDKHVNGKLELSLPPTFLQHMINEAKEARNVLDGKGSVADIEHHKLWLLDIKGHLEAIKAELDPVEKELQKIAKKKACKFGKLFNKALEFMTYIESGVTDFEALKTLTESSIHETRAYLDFITDLYELRDSDKILGILLPDLLDHMSREQCYYLWKLGEDIDPRLFLKTETLHS